LGEGTSGTVKKCTKNGTNQAFAVKIVRYRGDTEILLLNIKEFKNHKRLNHKNIIKVHELYIDYITKKAYTVMELTECQEMLEVIKDLGHYSEAFASGIFKQVLSAINYLHLNGVCHRDLKPNNILVSKDGKIVKILDFNVSKFSEKNSKNYTALSTENYKMWTLTGTIAFSAPEVFTDTEYTESVDMWSAGVVLYTMLCGYQPFQADCLEDLIELIKKGKYEFHTDLWDNISSQAKDLVKCLLTVNHKIRYSPFQALMHPWVANKGKVSDKSISGVIGNLWSYLNRSNTRKQGMSPKVQDGDNDPETPNYFTRSTTGIVNQGFSRAVLINNNFMGNTVIQHQNKEISQFIVEEDAKRKSDDKSKVFNNQIKNENPYQENNDMYFKNVFSLMKLKYCSSQVAASMDDKSDLLQVPKGVKVPKGVTHFNTFQDIPQVFTPIKEEPERSKNSRGDNISGTSSEENVESDSKE
jgi:serine/threonine protein kinase